MISRPKFLRLAAILVLAGLLLGSVACRSNDQGEVRPPEIHYGEDMCEFCGMIISEERYAAGYLTEDGQEHIFDDIAGMVQAHRQAPDGSPVVAFFVHDYENITWIRAETAHYVLSQELPTPMLSGLAAFSSVESAEGLAVETGGQVFTFEELLGYYQQAASSDNGMKPQH
jgi:copper chaperone NosL